MKGVRQTPREDIDELATLNFEIDTLSELGITPKNYKEKKKSYESALEKILKLADQEIENQFPKRPQSDIREEIHSYFQGYGLSAVKRICRLWLGDVDGKLQGINHSVIERKKKEQYDRKNEELIKLDNSLNHDLFTLYDILKINDILILHTSFRREINIYEASNEDIIAHIKNYSPQIEKYINQVPEEYLVSEK